MGKNGQMDSRIRPASNRSNLKILDGVKWVINDEPSGPQRFMRDCLTVRPSNSFFWSGIGEEAQGQRLRLLFTGKGDFKKPSEKAGETSK